MNAAPRISSLRQPAGNDGRFAGIVSSARSLGPGNYLLYAIDRLAGTLGLPIRLFRYVFVAQPVAEVPLLPERRGRNIAVRRAEPDDPAFVGLSLDDGVLAFRFDQGAICFVAEQDGRTIGCLWLCIGRYREDEVDCEISLEPADHTAWDFDVYVIPEARSSLAFLKLWDSANAFMRERRIAWSISRISAFNTGSLQVHGKFGTRILGSATFLRIGRAQLLLSCLRPYVHFSTRYGRAPCITLSGINGSQP